ncbi:MAG: 4Fe-4S dicluster domain-containing protein [Chloroflexi bacterium]|nr:4Fe-4S dicluster domain-containing protein [Chloroflexota bacterium]
MAIPSPLRGYEGRDAPSERLIDACVRCGFCLPTCPTYAELAVETSSPRGRLALMKAVGQGRLALDSPGFVHQMYECLGCRACEAVCPSGVQYGALLEAARDQIERHVARPGWVRLVRAVVFGALFRDLRVFRGVAATARLYQRSGLQRLVRASGVLRLLGLDTMEALLPPMARHFVIPRGQSFSPAAGPVTRRVALVSGCIMSTAYAEIDRATARVLAANGCEVIVPAGQECCGALHVHAGDLEGGRMLARRNIDAFERAGADLDAIVINAAGCGAALKEYGHLLHDDPTYAARAAAFSARVKDISEFLASLPLDPRMGALDLTVTYQEPCHLVHAQRIAGPPRAVLSAIPGVRLVEMAESSLCCGSAGVYNVTQPALSRRLMERKSGHALASGADVVVSANPGCLLQLQAGLRAAGAADRVRVRHVVELLDEAYRRGGVRVLERPAALANAPIQPPSPAPVASNLIH